jgi:hypothetical protein
VAIDLGDPLPNLSVTTRNAAGQLENAGSVVLTLTLPDQTTTAPSVTNPSAGVYTATYVTVQAGRHLARWVATGLNASSYTDAYVVRPADPGMLISLDDARRHLNEQSTLQDEEIRTFVEVATAIIEGIIGPVAVRTYTERVRNGTWLLKLLRSPVVSVTSITSIKTPTTTWVTADLDVDNEYGIVYLANQGSFTNGPWTAVYKAGRTVPSPKHVQAVKEQLWSMWYSQRGQLADSTTPDLLDVGEFESRVPFGLGFLVPYRVQQMLEYDQIPGIA